MSSVARERSWDRRADDYEAFLRQHGRAPRPKSENATEASLCCWWKNHRSAQAPHRRGRIQEIRELRSALNIASRPSWSARADRYEAFLLAEERRPSRYSAELSERRLNQWWANQAARRSARTSDEKRRLSELKAIRDVTVRAPCGRASLREAPLGAGTRLLRRFRQGNWASALHRGWGHQ